MEKRAIATIHELLSLTVEKKITLERIAHFRMAKNLPKKLKDFLQQHQGIFYVSTRGNQGKLSIMKRCSLSFHGGGSYWTYVNLSLLEEFIDDGI
ncbi:hypothetical protein JHK87_025083 [Glycine soja]|nr:hypothetical protein JHK87_025083 [Glycine soja]